MISIFKYIFLFLFSLFSFGFNIDLTKPNELMNVLYHETTNFEEHNRKEQNAINRGKTGAGIFSLKNFGNENTNGMSKTEWIVANADKDTISNGTLGLVSDLYNTATKKGEGEPFIISSVLTGLVVAGSLYSIQDSARKIYAWFDGEGYNGNTTYIDPIDGRIYTAEENIEEGAIELGAAATAGIVVKGVGKVVSKAKATKTLSKATEVTKNTKITGSKIKSVIPNIENTANHIFFNKLHDHKLDKILEKYSGDAIKATEDIAKSVNNYLSSNTVSKGIQDISVKVSNVDIVVRGKVENNMFKISTAWLKE